MASSIFYSILFLDPNGNHVSSDVTNGLTFFRSIDDLFQSFGSPTEVKFPVCVCTPNKSDILCKLEECSNVASIHICVEQHHNSDGEDWRRSFSKVKGEIAFDKPVLWQLNAHNEAYHANADIAQYNVVTYIKSIQQKLIEQLTCEFHISSEAR